MKEDKRWQIPPQSPLPEGATLSCSEAVAIRHAFLCEGREQAAVKEAQRLGFAWFTVAHIAAAIQQANEGWKDVLLPQEEVGEAVLFYTLKKDRKTKENSL